jgi:hypothetical protein
MCPCKFWNQPTSFDGLSDGFNSNQIMMWSSDGLISDGHALMALKAVLIDGTDGL